jgi:hypothetical protein
LPTVGIGWPASAENIAERRPSRPPPIAMNSDRPPTQWPIACTESDPVCSRTWPIAAGQSRSAMSSTVNWLQLDGRSGLAR